MTVRALSAGAVAEEAIIALLMRALVESDLRAVDSRAVLRDEIDALTSTVPAEQLTTAVLHASMMVNDILVDLAARPSVGRARSEVISAACHAVQAMALGRRGDLGVAQPAPARQFGREVWRFGSVVVDTSHGTVAVAGRPVLLTQSELRVLCCLVINHDEVASDLDLHEAAWPGRPVRTGAVTPVVNSLRAKLGDDARTQRLIRTAWGRGYRLAATLHVERRTRPEDDGAV